MPLSCIVTEKSGKVGAAVPLSVGDVGSHVLHCYLRTKWYPDPSSSYAVIDMGQKWGVIFSIAKTFREVTVPTQYIFGE